MYQFLISALLKSETGHQTTFHQIRPHALAEADMPKLTMYFVQGVRSDLVCKSH